MVFLLVLLQFSWRRGSKPCAALLIKKMLISEVETDASAHLLHGHLWMGTSYN